MRPSYPEQHKAKVGNGGLRLRRPALREEKARLLVGLFISPRGTAVVGHVASGRARGAGGPHPRRRGNHRRRDPRRPWGAKDRQATPPGRTGTADGGIDLVAPDGQIRPLPTIALSSEEDYGDRNQRNDHHRIPAHFFAGDPAINMKAVAQCGGGDHRSN
jgi:hypothetical protein